MFLISYFLTKIIEGVKHPSFKKDDYLNSSNNSGGYQGSYVQRPAVQGSNLYGSDDNRLIGAGFAFPFLLGGVTGAAIAPAFWRPPYNRPYYGSGPFYGPYYGPYRPF